MDGETKLYKDGYETALQHIKEGHDAKHKLAVAVEMLDDNEIDATQKWWFQGYMAAMYIEVGGDDDE